VPRIVTDARQGIEPALDALAGGGRVVAGRQ
jgi:hypothetical protein